MGACDGDSSQVNSEDVKRERTASSHVSHLHVSPPPFHLFPFDANRDTIPADGNLRENFDCATELGRRCRDGYTGAAGDS